MSKIKLSEIEESVKNCPFCGSDDICLNWNGPKGIYLLFCYSCDAKGPFDKCEQIAIQKWNRRTLRPSAGEVCAAHLTGSDIESLEG